MYDGYVFYCTKDTQQQCLSNKRYTCTDENKPSEKIKEGSVIFLYNTDDDSLLGPFTALSEGGNELDAGTWAMDIEDNQLSQNIKVTWEDLHIIRNAKSQLAFLTEYKGCRLPVTQTQRALNLLKQGELYLYAKKQ